MEGPPQKTTWWIVLAVAGLQIGVAVFAVASSQRDILSDGACLGGIFGTLANLVVLCGVVCTCLVLGVKSAKEKRRHPMLPLLFVLACSSGLAIFIGQSAALRCTV